MGIDIESRPVTTFRSAGEYFDSGELARV